jgi:hypothetical protein
MCNTLVNGFKADNNCDALQNLSDPSGANQFIYSATPDTMACKGSGAAPMVTGSVSMSATTSICCR